MTLSSHRVVIHVDMNCYFAAVEQKTTPAFRGKPVIVVGDLKRRSIVLTASYEARAYGIKTGDLFWDAKRRCPQVVPVVADHHKYTAQTEEIVALLEQFSSQVEMTSIDEGFLDVTGSLGLFKTDGAGLARMIQKRIEDDLRLPCSIGVAPNKLLAKLASGMKKPMGIVVILPEAVRDTLADLPVEEISEGPSRTTARFLVGLSKKLAPILDKRMLRQLKNTWAKPKTMIPRNQFFSTTERRGMQLAKPPRSNQ